MNHLALLACHGVLQMSVPDAAQHIGHCEPRTWRFYEAGHRAIPSAVIARLRTVLELVAQFAAQAVLCAQGKILPF